MTTLGSRSLYSGMVLALLVIAFHLQLSGAAAGPDAAPAPKGEGTRAGEERDDNSLKMKLIWCPPGRFKMGSPDAEEARDTDEKQVAVGLSDGFWLGKFEVTQSEWQQVMETEPWKGRQCVKESADYPVTYVSRDDAIAFCRKLTTQERNVGGVPTGFEYTLPTEAQWEYACRAGTATRFSYGNDTQMLSDHGWWGGYGPWGNTQNEAYAHRVGLKKPNPWGLSDMHGNVWEWCRDGYRRELPGRHDPEIKLPRYDHPFSHFVVRGGSWYLADHYCRSAFRFHFLQQAIGSELGFRLALSEVP